MEALRANLPTWLYLIHMERPWSSRLKMRIVDFRHSPSRKLPCPQEWVRYAPQESYVNSGEFPNWNDTGKTRPILLWFLIDQIEYLDPPVDLRNLSHPAFAERPDPPRYCEYKQGCFAFRQVNRDCFDKWIPLAGLSIGELPQYGAISAVYAMRSIGTGEILYIGSTNNLRRRVFGNYVGGVGGETTQRLHETLFSEGKIAEVELAWTETNAYQERETELKDEYRKQYGRLPKWNKL